MDSDDPQSLAAELRARAVTATLEERFDLLFLAAEYERLDGMVNAAPELQPVKVYLPK
ncbi:hypothetical protein LQ953_13740 [Sphingomonas sp. IC-56]|uniref:hypothetical protein n=1 Tax=Sphingomonas sp. IC-56 TaxID=2898529 RepID=UPI001E4DA45E|nr:hypothetical protein [Sphingomonas sp. IC-56]MCD2325079.1 hypothetical protein [Sphingomonas sp. IC-56]